MRFVVRIFHFVEVVHTYVMSSVSKSLDIKRRKNVVVVHSWEDRSHGSLPGTNRLYRFRRMQWQTSVGSQDPERLW